MEIRDAYLKTILRQQDAPVPWFFCLCNELVEQFRNKYGHTDYRRQYDIPLREVFLRPTRLDPKERFAQYWEGCGKEGALTEWGILLEPSSTAHFTHMLGPLRDRDSIQDAESLPLPDFLEEYRWEGVKEEVRRLKEQGYITFPGIYGGSDIGSGEENVAAFVDIFESTWYLRGLDNFLTDLYVNEEFAEALLEKITAFKVELAKRWTDAGVDILITADDVGAQNGLMMSADMYRRWIKPRLKRVIDAAKSINPNVLVFYHSDGNIEEIIPDLIEVGVEILNPIQPECMDAAAILRQYGDQVSFWGTIGTQTVLPFGSPSEVRDVCREMLSLIKGRGGLVLAPTHLVEPEVPLENIEALVEAVRQYNREKGF